jgi:hypothetical protein
MFHRGFIFNFFFAVMFEGKNNGDHGEHGSDRVTDPNDDTPNDWEFGQFDFFADMEMQDQVVAADNRNRIGNIAMLYDAHIAQHFPHCFIFHFTVTFEENNADADDESGDTANASADHDDGDISEPEDYCDGLRNLFLEPSHRLRDVPEPEDICEGLRNLFLEPSNRVGTYVAYK